jgi:hypothetical protein
MTQKLEDTIAALAKRGEQLAVKRAKAQDALDKATKARQDALLSGDLDDQRALDKLQANVDMATSALSGIDDALHALKQQQTEAEGQLAAERERVERAAAADKLNGQVAAIEAMLPKWLEQSRAFSDALSSVGNWHFDSGQMAGLVQSTMSQIEVAANFTLAELKATADAIRSGRHPSPYKEPPVAVGEPFPNAVRRQSGRDEGMNSNAILAEANFQPLDRGPERISPHPPKVSVPRIEG